MKTPLLALTLPAITAFSPARLTSLTVPTSTGLTALSSLQNDLTFLPPDTSSLSDPLAIEAANRMRRVMVPVSTEISDSGFVGVSYIHWKGESNNNNNAALPPLLLVHGFDSSSLEYRRLGPQLSSLGMDVYCVDLLGWGYTQLDSVKSFSAQAKVEALEGFWKVVGNNGDVVVGGASLGGAAVIEFAERNLYQSSTDTDGDKDQGFVRGTILIDAQGFVDGIGPMSFLPTPLAKLGIQVLKSVPLRSSANQMSYHDPSTYATEDALQIGRMHTLRSGWENSMLSFMSSGGFRPSSKVSSLQAVPTLILWGRQDDILKGEEFAYKFLQEVPGAELRWVEECGHVPHLEKAEVTAGLIGEFLREKVGVVGEKRSGGVGGVLDGLLSLVR